jgi:Parvulin-like peptidyl-prolyl isomerase
MLMDKLREGAQGSIAKIIFWLIIFSFALAGVGSYLNRPVNTDPADVNGEPITAQALERAYGNERARLESQFGDSFSQLASNPAYVQKLRKSVLDKLVGDLLLDQQAFNAQIRVGDEQVKGAIRKMPEFQQDGNFDNERYINLLGRAGLTPKGFSDSIRMDLVRQGWVGGIVGSEFALPSESKRLNALLQQTRDLTLYTVPASHFVAQVTASDAEIDNYYKANQKLFMSPEKVKVSYILVDGNELAKSLKVTDADLKNYYDQHQELYQTPERRHVAHILVTDKDETKAKQKAEDLLAKIKSGEDFAKLAEANSADTLSAKKGGELDPFEKGVMDPAFEQASFALAKTGDLSSVIKSKFGFHIIKLLGVETQAVKAFDTVKNDVLAKLRTDKGHELFLDQQQKLSDLSFENPDSLDMVAEKLGIKAQTSDYITANTSAFPFSDPKFKQQAFSADLRDQNINSEVVALSDNVAVVLHVLDYKPAAVRSLTEVKNDVIAAVKAAKAKDEAVKQANALQVALAKGDSVDALLKTLSGTQKEFKGVTRNSSDLEPTVLRALFRMPKPAEGKPALEVIAQSNGDQAVLLLNKVAVSDKETDKMLPMVEAQLAQGKSSQTYQALLEQAKNDAEIVYRKMAEQPAD